MNLSVGNVKMESGRIRCLYHLLRPDHNLLSRSKSMAKHTLATNPTAFKCSVSGCQNHLDHKRRFCHKHAERFRKNGDPLVSVLPGRRRSTREERFWVKVNRAPGLGPTGDCWEWTGSRSKEGYGYFRGGETSRATHYAWFLAYGAWPKGMVRHNCDNPPCIKVAHLQEGTNAENMQDMKDRGRSTRGEKSGMARLTATAVRQIRMLRSQGLSQRAVGRRFNVSHSTVGAIELGRTWADVE